MMPISLYLNQVGVFIDIEVPPMSIVNPVKLGALWRGVLNSFNSVKMTTIPSHLQNHLEVKGAH